MRGNWSNKVDKIQPAVIKIFETAGFSVDTNSKAGTPDLTVAVNEEITFMVEVKSTPNAKLTPAQVKFHKKWKGKIYVVRSIEDAEKVVNEYRL